MVWRTTANFGKVLAKAATKALTTTKTVTAGESGTTFFLNSTTGFVTTLPAPEDGLTYKFVVKTVPTSGNCTVYANGGSDIIVGVLAASTADDLGATDTNADTISFVASTCVVGDWVEVVSDGTYWYVTGVEKVAEGITLTTAA